MAKGMSEGCLGTWLFAVMFPVIFGTHQHNSALLWKELVY